MGTFRRRPVIDKRIVSRDARFVVKRSDTAAEKSAQGEAGSLGGSAPPVFDIHSNKKILGLKRFGHRWPVYRAIYVGLNQATGVKQSRFAKRRPDQLKTGQRRGSILRRNRDRQCRVAGEIY